MSNSFIDTITKRRTQYALGKQLPVPQQQLASIIQKAVRLAPSSFNSQSSRVVILFGEHSVRLWDITKEVLRKIVPAEAFASTEAKLDAFAGGAGTILFFEDQSTVRGLQEKFSLYADKFPEFSEQSSGMAQFAVWSVLAAEGIGASLQHYNPLIDEPIAQEWAIPASWKLRAQMPFGSNEKPLPEKTFIADDTRFKVFA